MHSIERPTPMARIVVMLILLHATLSAQVLPAPGNGLATATLVEGKVHLRDFLRSIKAQTGVLVFPPSRPEDVSGDEHIELFGSVDALTFPMAEAILGLNGYEVTEHKLDDGTTFFSTRGPGAWDGSAGKLVVPLALGLSMPGLPTLVLQLENLEPRAVLQALSAALETTPKPVIPRLKLIALPDNKTLIITAHVEVLSRLAQWVEARDVEAEPILEVRQLDHANFRDMVEALGASPEKVTIASVLVDKRDPKPRTSRPTTHVYHVEFLKAADLREPLTQLIDVSGGALRPRTGHGPTASRIVNHDETNSLLVQAEPGEYQTIIDVLERIDRPMTVGDATRLIFECRNKRLVIQSTNPGQVDRLHRLIDDLERKLRKREAVAHRNRVKAFEQTWIQMCIGMARDWAELWKYAKQMAR